MTLLQLNYILEIACCGSINKAAQNLFVSQSAISSSIRELEEELGISIFIRSNRGIELSADGREFISLIRPIVEQQQRVQKLYEDKSVVPSSRLHISTQRYPFCVQAFMKFLEENPPAKYEYRIKETGIYQAIDDVFSRQSDLGIIFICNSTATFMKKVLAAKEIEFNEIVRVKPHAFLRRSHPLASKSLIKLEELSEYPYIVFDQENNISVNFSEEIILCGFQPSCKLIYVNDRATVYNVMRFSDAFSIGSGLLPEGFCDPSITSVPIESNEDEMRLGWIKLRNTKLSDTAKDFLSYLEECLMAPESL